MCMQGEAGLTRLLPATLFAFSGVMFRGKRLADGCTCTFTAAAGSSKMQPSCFAWLMAAHAHLPLLLGVQKLQPNCFAWEMQSPRPYQWLSCGDHAPRSCMRYCNIALLYPNSLLPVAFATTLAFSQRFIPHNPHVPSEIVMDLTDEEGDREAGIHTLPVMIGKRGALLSALACVAAGSAAAVCAAAAAVAAAAGGPLPAAQLQGALAAPVAVVVLATARLFQLAIGIMRSGFDQGVMSNAIEECLKPVGLSLILLAALAP